MTDIPGPTLIRRHIGRRFAALRLRAGLTQEQAAIRLERSRATVSRIEEGFEGVRFRTVDVQQMLDLYDAPATDREVLLALTTETRGARHRAWWHDFTESALPSWFSLYVSLEEAAETIREYQPELLPGLLQTRAYAEAINRLPPGWADEAEVRSRTEARMARQALLTRPRAPRLETIVSEAALHRIAGTPALAAEQFRHLLDLTRQGNVSLRVVPRNAGLHAGMAGPGGFILLRFPREPLTDEVLEPPLAYLESPTGAAYLTKPGEVEVYDRIWENLADSALDPEGSRRLITTLLEGLAP